MPKDILPTPHTLHGLPSLASASGLSVDTLRRYLRSGDLRAALGSQGYVFTEVEVARAKALGEGLRALRPGARAPPKGRGRGP